MSRFQIIERTGANLQKTLVDAMCAGELRTSKQPGVGDGSSIRTHCIPVG